MGLFNQEDCARSHTNLSLCIHPNQMIIVVYSFSLTNYTLPQFQSGSQTSNLFSPLLQSTMKSLPSSSTQPLPVHHINSPVLSFISLKSYPIHISIISCSLHPITARPACRLNQFTASAPKIRCHEEALMPKSLSYFHFFTWQLFYGKSVKSSKNAIPFATLKKDLHI